LLNKQQQQHSVGESLTRSHQAIIIITMRSLAILRKRSLSSIRGLVDIHIHISRRSQRALLSALLILGIIYHAVKQQEGVMLRQLAECQQNRTTTTFVTDKVDLPVCGLGNIPFQFGGVTDEKRQEGHSTARTTTSGHDMIQWTFPNITLRIYPTKY
jgi:hypothetical protein